MAEQFNYSSVLAPHMKHLLDIKSTAGISAHRMKWILKEFDDFANKEHLEDPHITDAFIQKWRATRISDCERTLRMASAYNFDGKEWMLMLYSMLAKATEAELYSVHFYAGADCHHSQGGR